MKKIFLLSVSGVWELENRALSALFFVEMSCKSYVNPELNSEIA